MWMITTRVKWMGCVADMWRKKYIHSFCRETEEKKKCGRSRHMDFDLLALNKALVNMNCGAKKT
jgi:hypothetical protein